MSSELLRLLRLVVYQVAAAVDDRREDSAVAVRVPELGEGVEDRAARGAVASGALLVKLVSCVGVVRVVFSYSFLHDAPEEEVELRLLGHDDVEGVRDLDELCGAGECAKGSCGGVRILSGDGAGELEACLSARLGGVGRTRQDLAKSVRRPSGGPAWRGATSRWR